MTVLIEAEEWAMTAGVIGLIRLTDEDKVSFLRNGIRLKAEDLEGLASRYIHKLITEFSVVERDVKKMNFHAGIAAKHPEKTKQCATEVRKIMNEQFKKIEKYFKGSPECEEISSIIETLKSITSVEKSAVIEESIKRYQNVASADFINEKLTLNYAKAVILNPFFGQTSILQPTFNAKNTHEHIEQIEKDFVTPAFWELKFKECLREATGYQEIFQFLEKHQETYLPFKDWFRKVKKLKTFEEVQNYIHEELLPCSFIDGLIATQSYEEMTFSPLALSRSKAVNFSWNFDKKQPVPMSAVARLLFFMAPLGLTFYSRRMGRPEASETFRFAGLILSKQPMVTLLKDNTQYKELRSGGATFEEAIIGVLQESLDKAKRIEDSYLFIEVHSNYQAKKTLLDYYHMPSYLASYLTKYGKALALLYHRQLRDMFLRTVLRGIDPKQVVFDYLREAVTNEYHGEGAYHATRERKRILDARKGVEQMGTNDKLITFIYYRGVELREKIVLNRSGKEEEGPYRASGRKKLEGIAYRLINATKAGNKQAFMDTVFRLYMGSNLEVPSVFIQSFKEDGLDFETIASAFIAGLLGNETSKKEGEVANG